jgi:hypothetical protein
MARSSITRARPYTPSRGRLAGETFTSERQYRNALSRLKGFTSFRAQQRAAKPVHSAAAFGQLKPGEHRARDRALDALSDMRRNGTPLKEAARNAGTTPEVVQRYAGSGLQRDHRGRYRATESDRLFRRMQFYDAHGRFSLDVKHSRTASHIAAYQNAVKAFAQTDDTSGLRTFRGKYVQSGKERYPYITDPAVLSRLRDAGELSFESIYEHAA